jgi:hypothetical protein
MFFRERAADDCAHLDHVVRVVPPIVEDLGSKDMSTNPPYGFIALVSQPSTNPELPRLAKIQEATLMIAFGEGGCYTFSEEKIHLLMP